MTLREIFKMISKNVSRLTEGDFFLNFLSDYGETFEILTRHGKLYVWDSSSISKTLGCDALSAQHYFPVGLRDFEQKLRIVVGKTLDYYPEFVDSKALKATLCEALLGRGISVSEKDDSCYLLTKVFALWFKDKYEQYYHVKVESPSEGLSSLFAAIIEETARRETSSSSVKIKSPYTIEEKIEINDIQSPLKERIIALMDVYYEAIDKTLEILSQKDLAIRSKFLNKIALYYSDFLATNSIGKDDKEGVKKRSDEAFLWCFEEILESVDGISMNNVYRENLKDYAMALAVYAFYKCRILLKVDKENAD